MKMESLVALNFKSVRGGFRDHGILHPNLRDPDIWML